MEKKSHCVKFGFGYEEWLFRHEWESEGWRCGFTQGVNASSSRLERIGTSFDLRLFTIQPDSRRRFVATIKAAEFLSDKQAKTAVDVFKKKGWFDSMLTEIQQAGGDSRVLRESEPSNILNIRFRVENVEFCKSDDFVPRNNSIYDYNRYKLHKSDFVDQFSFVTNEQRDVREVVGVAYERSAVVRKSVLDRADGKCEHCGAKGFETPDGVFLETHHIIFLSEKGPDTIHNVIALCPNHHREAHHGFRREQLKREFLSFVSKASERKVKDRI